MIKINLVPQRKAKRQPTSPGERDLAVGVAALLAAAARRGAVFSRTKHLVGGRPQPPHGLLRVASAMRCLRGRRPPDPAVLQPVRRAQAPDRQPRRHHALVYRLTSSSLAQLG